MSDTKHTNDSTSNKPRFSAGLVTGAITLAWLVVFGAVMMHGVKGVHQHDSVVSTQAE
ncbi:hypothetical protein [Pusillimonas sp.]|uniref:hypothetical protein n=1 Tax=Pusillimonas sp. TaxID=3040095 RepID=UPI0037CA3A75